MATTGPAASVSTETPDQRHARQLAAFLQTYRPIAQGLVKEFFVAEHWDKAVPAAWREPLEALPLDGLAELLSKPVPSNPTTVWPLSLLAFLASCHALQLPGQLDAHGSVRPSADGRSPEEDQLGVDLRRAVNPKKMHEIVHLGSATDRVAREAKCDLLVDVGSGQGYLSRALAFHYNWPVVAVEGLEGNVAASNQLDGKVRRSLAKRLKDERECAWQPGQGSLRHVAARLPPQATPQQLWAMLDKGQAVPAPAPAPSTQMTPSGPGPATGSRVALVGLHTCGDLACTILRVFDSAAEAVGAVVCVGCCYMHLTEPEDLADEEGGDGGGGGGDGGDGGGGGGGGGDGGDGDGGRPTGGTAAGSAALPAPTAAVDDQRDIRAGLCAPCESLPGYPMSAWVTRLRVPMGFHLREMACHHLKAYSERLAAAAAAGGGGRAEESLRGQCRRAALEWVLKQRRGAEGRTCVGVMKNSGALSFDEYVDASLRRLGLPSLGDDERRELNATCAPMLEQWRRVAVYFVLRSLLSPLWEALLLLDRLLFLRERGHDARLVPLFDPLLSPRNYAVVAVKPVPKVG